MKDFGKVRSTVKPEAMVIDDFSVWVCTDILEVTESTGETEFKGYEYSMVQYGKDEFILAQAAENADMKQKVTDTQLALAEVYELMA